VSIEAEARGLDGRVERLGTEIASLERRIESLRPAEREGRSRYEQAMAARLAVGRGLDLLAQREDLRKRLATIEGATVGKQRAEGLRIGIDGPTSHAFSKVVREVLEAWEFPDLGSVSFEEKPQDIAVNARPRRANGKGVRAILHSAFKVAVLLHCRRNGFPHPGFLVLDSPLVTYRKPIMNERYGELGEDERRLQESSLKLHFYRHLASIAAQGQVFVIENDDPPDEIRSVVKVELSQARRARAAPRFLSAAFLVPGSSCAAAPRCRPRLAVNRLLEKKADV
jgi:hypothetical protein